MMNQRGMFMVMAVAACVLQFTTANQKMCHQCSCSQDGLQANCTASNNLKSIPITLNPRLTSYIIRDTDIADLGVSRPFDVYTFLVNLDLSNNKLQEIPVNTFQNQKQLRVSLEHFLAKSSPRFLGNSLSVSLFFSSLAEMSFIPKASSFN